MNTKLSCWMLVVALSASLLACGEEDTPRGGETTDEDTGLTDAGDDSDSGELDDDVDSGDSVDGGDETDVGTDTDEIDDPINLNIEGIWAAKMVTSGISEVPVVGEAQSDTVSILRMEVTQDEQNVTVLTETCDVTIEGGGGGVTPVIPDALVDSLPISERSGTYVGGDLVLPTIFEVRGAQNFDDLQNDALPEDAEDPRVYDQDEDGNPGVTVSLEGLFPGDIYLVQRSSNALVGSQEAIGRIAGRVSWTDEQSILGASDPLLTAVQPESEPNSDPDASFFEMVGVEDTLDCDAIVGQVDTLFTR